MSNQNSLEWFWLNLTDDLIGGLSPEKISKIYQLKEQAKEMYIVGKERSYAEGYSAGYYRALELVEWKIKNELKIDNTINKV